MEFINKVLSIKEQSQKRNNWLKIRLDNLLSSLMTETKIDFWLVIGREYNEDPIMKTLMVHPENSTGRLGIFAFYLNNKNVVERYSFYTKGGRFCELYEPIWDEAEGDQWDSLKKLIENKNPKCIGVNFSEISAKADGISSSHYSKLIDKIGEQNAKKIVSAQNLAIRWLETRIDEEIEAYTEVCKIMHNIIKEVFSSKTINVGVTSTDDLQWIFMEKIKSLGLENTFPTDVNVQRKGNSEERISNTVIQYGDIIRCDVGLEYLGLNADIQRLAYVMHPEDAEVPEGIEKAIKAGNAFQDIVCKNMVKGRTGNEIFFNSIEDAKLKNIDARLYSHPIGYHTHGAGPTIGLWNNQGFVAGAGEICLHNNTCYALELNVKVFVPEWNQTVTVCLEEDIAFVNNKTYYINSRQESIYIIN